ncbi:MAG: universal stress protein [Candidatus Sumerlaeota bacterium]|nr:universal stress protein [Candidatus Sumerlaeota bacterium]
MFKHLLIPLDGSTMAEAVLPAAAQMALKCRARVTLLHVIERDAPASVHGQSHLVKAEQAEAYLKRIAASAFPPEVKVDWHVHPNQVRDVAHSLAEHAEEFTPDLIVLCAHGESRLRDWISGSIAQQVVHQRTAPVLQLQPDASGAIVFPFRQMLAPLDGNPAHEVALPIAAGVSVACGAQIHLLMVVPTSETLSGSQAMAGSFMPEAMRAVLDIEVEQATQYLGRHVAELKGMGLGLEVAGTVTRGDPADQITQIAKDRKADLIVLGTHGKTGMEAFWEGSLAARLLRRIPASFLLAPAPEKT